MDRPAALIYPDWPQYAARIRDAVVDLTADQLALRAGPEHGQIWQLAAHSAGTRVFWLCGIFGEPGADTTPFANPLAQDGWEDDETHPRSGDELRWALDTTWALVAGVLGRWTVDSLDQAAVRMRADGTPQVHTRASVLNRMMSHDAFHAGEISQLLGLHQLPPIDLWIRAAPPPR
jgi:uncharacterized damage-inducible protein DinB